MIRATYIINLLEAYYGRIKPNPKYPIKVSTEVFLNPTQKELRGIGDEVRFYGDAKKQQIFVWHSEILHHEAEAGLLGYRTYEPGILLGGAERHGSVYEMTGSDQLIWHGKENTLFDYDWFWADKYIKITPYLKEKAEIFGISYPAQP